MIERVHNMRASVVRKRLSNDEAGGSPCKKGRPKGSILLNRYPSLNTDLDFSDAASDERNRKALERELAREPPRKEYVRSLLRQTYAERRYPVRFQRRHRNVNTHCSPSVFDML